MVKNHIRLCPTIKNISDLPHHTLAYVCACMTFEVVKQLNPIGSMKMFPKPNCNICIEQHLTILKKLCDECVVYMNKKHIYTVADGTRELSVIFP